MAPLTWKRWAEGGGIGRVGVRRIDESMEGRKDKVMDGQGEGWEDESVDGWLLFMHALLWLYLQVLWDL